MSTATVVDLPNEHTVILQAHESLYLPDKKYTILSATQMREHGVEVNDKAKCHKSLQDIIVDEQQIVETQLR